jgi:hypothetical protein
MIPPDIDEGPAGLKIDTSAHGCLMALGALLLFVDLAAAVPKQEDTCNANLKGNSAPVRVVCADSCDDLYLASRFCRATSP